MFNPDIKFAKSKGVDLPLMYVYLAGRIAGECIEACLAWRKLIVDHYKYYKPIVSQAEIVGYEAYPISFLDALNSKEADSIDKLGLSSAIPSNLIYDKDLLSVKTAHVVVANMDDFFEKGIEDLLNLDEYGDCWGKGQNNYVGTYIDSNDIKFWKQSFLRLQEKIKDRRPNWGTYSEVAWALYLNKPVILIAPNEKLKGMLEKHPFMKRASVIVGSVEQLLEEKWLSILYKSISGATY